MWTKKKFRFQYFVDNLLYTKDNEILLLQNTYPGSGFKLVLFDFKNKMDKELIYSNGNQLIYEPFKFLNKNIVAVIMNKTIYLIDIYQKYNIITKFESKNFGGLNCLCVMKNNCIITGDDNGILTLLEFKNDQLNYKKNIGLE